MMDREGCPRSMQAWPPCGRHRRHDPHVCLAAAQAAPLRGRAALLDVLHVVSVLGVLLLPHDGLGHVGGKQIVQQILCAVDLADHAVELQRSQRHGGQHGQQDARRGYHSAAVVVACGRCGDVARWGAQENKW